MSHTADHSFDPGVTLPGYEDDDYESFDLGAAGRVATAPAPAPAAPRPQAAPVARDDGRRWDDERSEGSGRFGERSEGLGAVAGREVAPVAVEEAPRPLGGEPARRAAPAAPAVIDASTLEYGTPLTELSFTDVDLSLEDPGSQGYYQRPMEFSKYFMIDEEYRSSWTGLARVLNEAKEDRGRVHFQGMPMRYQKTNSTRGKTVFVRRLHPKIRTLEQLKVDPAAIRQMKTWHTSEKGGGLVIMCGRTGHGKTTTLGAFLDELLRTVGGKAYTVEEPPEMELAGDYHDAEGNFRGRCYQHEVFSKDWDSPLENALRAKPDYIYLGEILTPAVAYEAISMANTGHLVMTTIHGGTVGEALGRLIKKATAHEASGGIESIRYDLSYCLRAVCHQTLGPGGPYLKIAAPDVEARIAEFRTAIQAGNTNALRGAWVTEYVPAGLASTAIREGATASPTIVRR